jgi:hypothetical protein
MAFSGRAPDPPKAGCQNIMERSDARRLRLRKILRGDPAGQAGTERGSIGERLRPGHHVHAVGFGRVQQERGRDADASGEG